MTNTNLELAQKLKVLTHKFHANPDVLFEYYNLKIHSWDQTLAAENQIHILRNADLQVLISTGGKDSKELCKSYILLDGSHIIKYPGHSEHPNNNVLHAFDKKSDFFNLKDNRYDLSIPPENEEEFLFQQSLVLPSFVYDSFELMLYIRRTTNLPFMVNLKLLNIDEALGVYDEQKYGISEEINIFKL